MCIDYIIIVMLVYGFSRRCLIGATAIQLFGIIDSSNYSWSTCSTSICFVSAGCSVPCSPSGSGEGRLLSSSLIIVVLVLKVELILFYIFDRLITQGFEYFVEEECLSSIR